MFLFNFHSVAPAAPTPRQRKITLTPQGLRAFIRTLRRCGVEIVSLRDVLDADGLEAVTLRRRQAILTFDDGFENFHHHAAPILAEEDCPATVFVLPGKLAGFNDWDTAHLPAEEREPLLSLAQMQGLNGGITLGSHGMTHRRLSQLPAEALAYELEASFAFLQTHCPQTFVPAIAYPWGDYSPTVLAAMAHTPYRAAFTTAKGRWTPDVHRHTIPRLPTCWWDAHPAFLMARLVRNGLF